MQTVQCTQNAAWTGDPWGKETCQLINDKDKENTTSSTYNSNFGKKTNFRLGLEIELPLSFHKNKWSIFFEPTYRNFKSENKIETSDISGGVLYSNITYQSVEVPLGLRHYIFLSKNSKLFVNGFCLFDIQLGSSLNFTRADGSTYDKLEKLKSGIELGLGAGYKYSDKYSLELRYQTPRNILTNYRLWNAEYTAVSVIVGYTLF